MINPDRPMSNPGQPFYPGVTIKGLWDLVFQADHTYWLHACLRRAQAESEAGDWAQSVAECSKVIVMAPTWASPHYFRVWAKWNSGDMAGANADYAAALRLDANHPLSNNLRALGMPNHAQSSVGEVVDPDCDSLFWEFGTAGLSETMRRAQASAEGGHWADAIVECTQALQIAPKWAVAYFFRAWANWNLGDETAAAIDYATAFRLRPDHGLASRLWDVAARANAVKAAQLDRVQLYDVAALLAAQADAVKAAQPAESVPWPGSASRDDAVKEWRIMPGQFVKPGQFGRGPSHCSEEGGARFVAGDYQGAIRGYTDTIENHNDKASSYLRRGVARIRLGQDLEALSDLNMAIEMWPTPDAYFERAYARLQLQDSAGAIDDFTLAIKTGPGIYGGAALFTGEAYFNRALAHFANGHQVQAIADFDKAITLLPADIEPLCWHSLATNTPGADSIRNTSYCVDAIPDHAVFQDYGPHRQDIYSRRRDAKRRTSDEECGKSGDAARLRPPDGNSGQLRSNQQTTPNVVAMNPSRSGGRASLPDGSAPPPGRTEVRIATFGESAKVLRASTESSASLPPQSCTPDWHQTLINSLSYKAMPTHQQQTMRTKVIPWLDVLHLAGGTMQRDRFAQEVGILPARVPGAIATMQDCLCTDGYMPVTYDPTSGTIVLQVALLKQMYGG